jgi:polysaccharide export outer membrane protein
MRFLLVALGVLLGVPVSGQEKPAPGPGAQGSTAQTPASRVPDRLAEYRLGAGDSIRISVFQNPNLTLETRVGEDGAITYPLIGRVAIGGATLAGAEQTIAKALEAGNYIREPQVTMLLLLTRSSQVSVLGLVNRAGRYPLDSMGTRVSEMIAIAGGIAPAGGDLAILAGERAGKPFRKEIDIAALFLQKGHGDDIAVQGGDVIYVDRAPMFYVYGEVNRPGAYRLERGMTLRHALARGGGPTQRGTERSLRLHRRGADNQVQVINHPKLDDLARPEDVLHVGESLF